MSGVPRESMITALFYVQHLLGIGHVMRAAALARGLERAGIRVVLVSGGMPTPLLDAGTSRVEQLPPVRTLDESFSCLVDAHGQPVDENLKARRRGELLAVFERERPDILLTELYPFGRRQMAFELEPLLAHAQARRQRGGVPVIVSSIRDILVSSKRPGRSAEIVECVRRYYDLVLVHGDENVIPLECSFPRSHELADLMHSTGYVVGDVPARQHGGAVGCEEVIVSTGGGAVSAGLLEAALGARALSRLRSRIWRVLVGQDYPEACYRSFCATAPEGVLVERARSDFVQLLANCTLSISRGGYNTVAEILACGARAVCVPFAGDGETEQTLRCRMLAERGLLQCVEDHELSPERVATAIDRALEAEPPRSGIVDTDGVRRSAAILLDAIRSRHAQTGVGASPAGSDL